MSMLSLSLMLPTSEIYCSVCVDFSTFLLHHTHWYPTTGACTLLITLERSRFENKILRLNFAKPRTTEKVLQLNRINRTRLEHDNFKDFCLYLPARRMNTIKEKNLECSSLCSVKNMCVSNFYNIS